MMMLSRVRQRAPAAGAAVPVPRLPPGPLPRRVSSESGRGCFHCQCEIKYKKPHFQYKLRVGGGGGQWSRVKAERLGGARPGAGRGGRGREEAR
eukprot:2232460-Rhodomonas_salina.1